MDSDDQNVDVARPRGVSMFNTYTNVLLQLGFNNLDFPTHPLPLFFFLDKFLTYSIKYSTHMQGAPHHDHHIHNIPFPQQGVTYLHR